MAGEARRVVLLGPPNSGKGTQAAILAERLGVPAISTGVYRFPVDRVIDDAKVEIDTVFSAHSPVSPTDTELHAAIRSTTPFDPATAERDFTIVSSDYADFVILPRVLRTMTPTVASYSASTLATSTW